MTTGDMLDLENEGSFIILGDRVIEVDDCPKGSIFELGKATLAKLVVYNPETGWLNRVMPRETYYKPTTFNRLQVYSNGRLRFPKADGDGTTQINAWSLIVMLTLGVYIHPRRLSSVNGDPRDVRWCNLDILSDNRVERKRPGTKALRAEIRDLKATVKRLQATPHTFTVQGTWTIEGDKVTFTGVRG